MAESNEKKREPCHLHKAQGLEAWSTRERCIYWRLLEAQDMKLSNKQSCGLQHYKVIENLQPEMAKWLLAMKKGLRTQPLRQENRGLRSRAENKNSGTSVKQLAFYHSRNRVNTRWRGSRE